MECAVQARGKTELTPTVEIETRNPVEGALVTFTVVHLYHLYIVHISIVWLRFVNFLLNS